MITEAEVAFRVEAWLQCRGLAVHREVVFGGARCDLVGRDSENVVAVEAKLRLSLDVLAQADHWKASANECWVAIPRRRSTRASRLGLRLADYLGIGVLEVDPHMEIREAVRALYRDQRGGARLAEALVPEQQTQGEAGSNRGGYSTAFSRTATRLAAWVAEHPGGTLREAVGAIEHEYKTRSSAVGALSKWLNLRGKRRPSALSGVRIEGRGGRAQLWPTEGEF